MARNPESFFLISFLFHHFFLLLLLLLLLFLPFLLLLFFSPFINFNIYRRVGRPGAAGAVGGGVRRQRPLASGRGTA